MNKKTKIYTLDDGTTTTVEQMVKELNWAKSTCHSRLTSSTDPSRVYRSLSPTRKDSRIEYTLDDGSKWTAVTLADFLAEKYNTKCKTTTAGGRLCTMDGNSKKIFSPLRKSQFNSDESKSVKKMVNKRMYFDVLGHWALLNRCL
ncbi:MAG: hypothetical protein NZ824_02970 [Candidatus Thioglobus sp.]|nr:hypothetical protein [Candidatus Thioglobus sp.]